MEQAILYFDGLCVLCNKSIRIIINRDKKKRFKIGFLQSHKINNEYDSVILFYKGQKYNHSTAIIKSLILLGGIYRCASVLFIFPKKLRDFVYKVIAKNRYKWFGKFESCPTLTIEWKKRMINKDELTHKQL